MIYGSNLFPWAEVSIMWCRILYRFEFFLIIDFFLFNIIWLRLRFGPKWNSGYDRSLIENGKRKPKRITFILTRSKICGNLLEIAALVMALVMRVELSSFLNGRKTDFFFVIFLSAFFNVRPDGLFLWSFSIRLS